MFQDIRTIESFIAEIATSVVVFGVVALIAFAFIWLLLWIMSFAVVSRGVERVPVVGPLVGLAAKKNALKKTEGELRRQELLDKAADRIVEAKEQLILNGKLDRSTAAARATQRLSVLYEVQPDKAAMLIEAAVYRNNQRRTRIRAENLLAENPRGQTEESLLVRDSTYGDSTYGDRA